MRDTQARFARDFRAGRFFGFDQDADAIEAAGERLKEFGDQVTIIRSNYCNMVGIEKKGNYIS